MKSEKAKTEQLVIDLNSQEAQFSPTHDAEVITVKPNGARTVRMVIKASRLEEVTRKLRTAHKSTRGAWKHTNQSRSFPKFKDGMTTKEYVVMYMNINRAAHILPIDFDAIGDRPAATYDGGALDFDVICEQEEENEEGTINEAAARDVAAVVASAAAGAAIEQASEAAALGELASTEQAPEMVRVESESRELVTTCEAGAMGGNTSTSAPSVGHAGTTGANAARMGQTISSKSGSWTAKFRVLPDGSPCMDFCKNPSAEYQDWQVRIFESGRERMQALQTMAHNADAAASAATKPAGVCPTTTPHPTQYAGADGTDYTDPRETSTPDYTTPRETSGALHIRMEQAEGREGEYGRVITAASFADADSQLMAWAETAPKTGGYYKCDFVITWPNGNTYSGRYDLKHHTLEKPSLTAHMVDGAEFYTGKNCPLHMNAAAYQNFMESVSEETRTAYAEVLQTMATLGAYTPKARPVAIDLRAVIAGGVPMSALIGAGVVYTGDMANQPSTGAIVSAEPCTWAGVRVVVQTEDGEVHHVTASQFGDKAGDRYRFDWKMHGAPYLAQLAAAVAAKHAQASSAKQIAQETHARALVELVAEFPQLKRAEPKQYAGSKLAAVNARILLKAAFKGVKFSVTSERSSLTVRWTDGPTSDAVNAIIGRFDIGASDSQSDYFYTIGTAWSELFGGAQYFNTYREMSDGAITEIIAAAWPENDGDPRPTLDDYRHARGVFGWRNENYWSRDRINKAIDAWTGPAK